MQQILIMILIGITTTAHWDSHRTLRFLKARLTRVILAVLEESPGMAAFVVPEISAAVIESDRSLD